MIRLTEEQLAAHNKRIANPSNQTGLPVRKPKKPSKMRNKVVETPEGKFDSQKELNRYRELCLLRTAGKIGRVYRQVRYGLDVNKIHICDYVADFSYEEFPSGRIICEDVKPTFKSEAARKAYQATDAYRRFIVKKRLMFALQNIEVIEV